jgi:hypothetical protein
MERQNRGCFGILGFKSPRSARTGGFLFLATIIEQARAYPICVVCLAPSLTGVAIC